MILYWCHTVIVFMYVERPYHNPPGRRKRGHSHKRQRVMVEDETQQPEGTAAAAMPTSTPTIPMPIPAAPTATSSKKSKEYAQIVKLRDANAKYKSLLKMAKERIQKQEEELEQHRTDANGNEEKMEQWKDEQPEQQQEQTQASEMDLTETTLSSDQIVKVCQRIQQQDSNEIWALFEFEAVPLADSMEISLVNGGIPSKKYKQWKRFDSEPQLEDFIRRDTGEPLSLPAVSLSPEQSEELDHKATQKVSQITEEFRRFRVRTEISRKQTESQLRDLHSNLAETATRRIEGQDIEKELHQAKVDHILLEKLQNEMDDQESRWKSAYDLLLNENTSLKSSGSEALLAAQWRQRYEVLLKEKEDVDTKLGMQTDQADEQAEHNRKTDVGRYEMKYRDLKESFRLYRKKAKEIFEAQQKGDMGLLNISDVGKEDAKLSYLKNLMVNYLSADETVKDHMEGAIGTVLKFSPEELDRIEKKKGENMSTAQYLTSYIT